MWIPWRNACALRGYDVRVVYDGLSALQEADKDTPDVAVLDLLMPGLSGDEALHRLKAAHPGLPVIVLTGHEAVDDNGVCPLAQASACLTKPLAFRDFLAAVQAAAVKARRRRRQPGEGVHERESVHGQTAGLGCPRHAQCAGRYP